MNRFEVSLMKTFHIKKVLFFLLIVFISLLGISVKSHAQFRLYIHLVNKDSTNDRGKLESKVIKGLETTFPNKNLCTDYIFKLTKFLSLKGFPASSVDSISFDSSAAYINLYLGNQYKWLEISTSSVDKKILDETGWNEKHYSDIKLDFSDIKVQEQKMLQWLAKNGYPFASIRLDSIHFVPSFENMAEGVNANLIVEKGPLYHIDSIRLFGKVKIRNLFLQHYLSIRNGSLYSTDKLAAINRKLLELPYIRQQQRWDISMLGTGSVLNLYLQPRPSSQINFLVGFLPSTQTGKSQLTGDINLNLKNSLGLGETIFLTWQQLQRQSPRLTLGYQQPFIFNSSFGIDFNFDLLKRDSTFLQLDGQIGVQYLLSSNQSGKIFFQTQRTYLLPGGIDTNQIRHTKKLPVNVDVASNSLGLDYEWYNTNYRFNPRKGNELIIVTSVGLKKITKNNDIANLIDPLDPGYSFNSLYDSIKLNSYQIKIKFSGAHYVPLAKRSTLKGALNAGFLESPNVFRNELFQIGGYKLLRGFNEESIYATRYAVLTGELRYLVGINRYLFIFTDLAATTTHFQTTAFNNTFIGVGAGLAFETKIGFLNFTYAVGKRNDVNFNIREASKIHFGYVNYF